MTSQVDIVNAAIGKLGQDIGVASMAENTKHAKVFNRCWSRVRDYVLADGVWLFAVKTQALAVLAQTSDEGWTYRYAYPADCMTMLTLFPALAGALPQPTGDWCDISDWTNRSPYAYTVAYGTQGTSILAQLPSAYAQYVARIEDTERYPPSFVEALACRLAWDSAGQLAGETGLRLRQQLMVDYRMAKSEASAHGLNEADGAWNYTTPSIAARYG